MPTAHQDEQDREQVREIMAQLGWCFHVSRRHSKEDIIEEWKKLADLIMDFAVTK